MNNAAIRLVREMDARRILAGDSPGSHKPDFCGKISGLGDAARDDGVEYRY